MDQYGQQAIKDFYQRRSETNWAKRFNSPYLLPSYFSRTVWKAIAREVQPAPLVSDAGCVDGVLSVLTALWHTNVNSLLGMISKEMDVLLFGYHRSPTGVGFYKLAKSVRKVANYISVPYLEVAGPWALQDPWSIHYLAMGLCGLIIALA